MISAVIIILIVLLSFSSCARKYELTVSATAGGSVTMDPAGGMYTEGTRVTLTAVPESGYYFTGWGNTGDYSADYTTDAQIEITMPGDSINISSGFALLDEGWIFLIYMAGDNSLSGQVGLDLNEMEQGLYEAVSAGNTAINDDVKILALTDRNDTGDTILYLIRPGSSISIVSPEIINSYYPSGNELNMGDGDTLKNFVKYGMQNYPSEHNALVLWNHGGGVKSLDLSSSVSREICEDTYNGEKDLLYLNELQTAISSSLTETGRRLDIIGMDACIMGEVETAYELRNLTDYFVASMANEWGYGWDYSRIFDDFSTAGIPPTPSEMADILVAQYQESSYGISTSWPNTLTAVKTAGLENLKTEIDTLAQLVHESGEQAEFEALRAESVLYEVPYYDIYDLCQQIQASEVFGPTGIDEQAAAVQSALAAAVAACYGDSSELGLDYYETDDAAAVRGLSIFITDSSENYATQWWYTTDSLSVNYVGSDNTFYIGEIDFCTYQEEESVDGVVETWRELFEAWYDYYPSGNYGFGTGNGYTPGNY